MTETDKPSTISDSWTTWQADPSQENMFNTVKALQPTLDVALHGVGANNDPYMKAKARTIAAHAIRTYDPASGAGLPTWATQQLMRLRRIKRQSQSPIRLPERMQIENYTLEQATARYVDEHDKEPDVQELSDLTNIPLKRISDIRKTVRKVPSEAAFGVDGAIISNNESEPEFMSEAIDIVYQDVDYLDRKILEMKSGYGGHAILDPAAVAVRLKLTPSQLSRRSKKLAYQIQLAEADLQDL